MKVEIKCETSRSLPLDQIHPMQGDLKKLDKKNFDKLYQQIIDEGFISPFFVWKNGDKFFLLDGHQRYNVIKEMTKKPVILPHVWPIVEIQASNYKQACKRILALSSQYGTMTKEGLKEFIEKATIEQEELFEEYQFDCIDFEKFNDDFNPPEGDIDDQDQLDERKEKIFKCPNCGVTHNLKDFGF
jgi:hypothetical protein